MYEILFLVFKLAFWFFVIDWVILMCIGLQLLRGNVIIWGQIAILYYFIFF